MTNKLKKILSFSLIFLFIFYFKPAPYVLGSKINNLWQYFNIFASVIYIVLYFILVLMNKVKINKWLVLFYLFSVYIWFISTLFSKSEVALNTALYYLISSLGIMTLFGLGIQLNAKKTLQSIVYAGMIMSFIHIITMFKYYNLGGMYHGIVNYSGRQLTVGDYYFFTHDNGAFFIIFPVLILSWIYLYKFASKIEKAMIVVFTSILCLSYIYTWSVTAMVIYIIFVCMILLFPRKKRVQLLYKGKKISFKKLFSIKNFLILIMVISILFTFYKISLNYSEFIEENFHKSADLTGRLDIWDASIKEIENSILLGYGWETDLYTFKKINMNHTHNMLLQILYTGGIVGLFLFALVVIKSLNNFKKIDENEKNIKLVFTTGIVLYFIASIFDYYLYQYWIFLIFQLIYLYPEIQKKK